MEQDLQSLQKQLDHLAGELYEVLDKLVVMRRQSPRMKAETARLMENYMIQVSRKVKEIGKANNDDLMEGISLLKIKMMS